MRIFLIALLLGSGTLGASSLGVLSGSPPSSSTPTGNVWTIVGFNGAAGVTNTTSVAGTTGDILLIYVKWENAVTITGITEGNGATVNLIGSSNDHANGNLHSRWAYCVTNSTGAQSITPAFSGAAAWINIGIYRVSVSGTPTYALTSNGTGTSTSASSGAITTATLNGLNLGGSSLYSAATTSSMAIGGNAATNTHALDVDYLWDYANTAKLTSASATATLSGSVPWICSILSVSAQ
jgi:hypothetical protein